MNWRSKTGPHNLQRKLPQDLREGLRHLRGNGSSVPDLKEGKIGPKEVHGDLEAELKASDCENENVTQNGHYIDAQKYPHTKRP